ncbi:DEAD/DEAH box helicase [Leuconostoc inhae]|uniref:DEAD/DEAH box helicase n=1 Tax=Leuconostoc inhae TaxID=178001 RepID=UPI001C7DA4B3|nr:DEAD/DEAH box helicase [Leuconostoc inhae]
MKAYYGRQLVQAKVNKVPENVISSAAFIGNTCQRCGQNVHGKLPNDHFYCRACLALGRVSSLDVLLSLPEPNDFDGKDILSWTGQLTPQQKVVGDELLETLSRSREHLVWAVTGAGKTEMLFPVIHQALSQKYRVAIVSPRVDVILELAPRLQQAFSQTDMVVLHGAQTETYRYTSLVLATTHQMLRFKEAFDLLIVDEVDSFPYAGDHMLAYAVKNARKINSSVIYLSATPTKVLQQQVKRHSLTTSYLPLRFHQHLLPVLKTAIVGPWRKKLPLKFLRQINQFNQTKRRFLIFVPKVSDLVGVYQNIRKHFPEISGDHVYAGDPKRQEKVQNMRNKKIQYLVTTTILERGVTFPGIDVLILGADEKIFSENALVQIAGRVGRNKDRPTGLVKAYVQHTNFKVIAAQRQIKQMNKRGRQLGGRV